LGDLGPRSALPPSTQRREEPTKSKTSGWSEPRPLEPPPGIELIDQQVDAADLMDRLALAKRLAGGGE
jgi:hypothetical protein